MKSICKTIQDTLATEGPRGVRDDEAAQQHVAECADCFRFLETLNELESGFEGLTEFDAPDAVVERLLAHPEIAVGPVESDPPARWPRLVAAAERLLRPRPLVWGSLATGFMIVVFAVVLRFEAPDLAPDPLVVARNEPADAPRVQQGVETERLNSMGKLDDEFREKKVEDLKQDRISALKNRAEPNAPAERDAGRDASGDEARLEEPEEGHDQTFFGDLSAQDADGDGRTDLSGSRQRDFSAVVGGVSSESSETVDKSRENQEFIQDLEVAQPPPPPTPDEPEPRHAKPKPVSSTKEAIVAGVGGVTNPVLVEDSRVDPTWPEAADRLHARVILQLIVRADGSVDDLTTLRCTHPGLGFEAAAIEAVSQWRFEPARQAGRPVDVYFTLEIEFDPAGQAAETDGSSLLVDPAVRTARAFLDERDAIDGLTFRPATGYWRTTYVPGDPSMRLLQSRLAGWDRSVLQASVASTPRLHDAARQVGQPFDTPDSSALAVYLHADRRGLTGPARMLVQVGLEGTPRHGGRRPAMNLALVLDLRGEIAPDVAIGIRSLLDAFNRAKEPGDSFRVFAAGRPGGCVVDPEQFRHGFLRVTLDRLVAAPAAPAPGLTDAVAAAISSVATPDDAGSPLGSNAVALITGRVLGAATGSLADLAHQGAVVGVPMSVIGIGSDVDLSEIDRVTLAGQGSRRLLDEAASAAELVDRELAAASRAVARAVRLRVRLAPGVKLVDVIGSERLDAARAREVRDAERSIDLRLARNLGIEADRGEDEEGIQIVIPGFYAGDSHAILLDVVVPGPGPVAEVTVRYKDLVHLRNGVARASLSLGRDERPCGPLERNVLKNLLTERLSRMLDDAGQALNSGEPVRATTLLDDFTALLEGLRQEVPGLGSDSELLQNVAMLAEYRTVLASALAARGDELTYIADSLRYAARLMLLPRPLETRS